MAKLTAYQRLEILHRTAEILSERREELGRTITMEEGKTIVEGRTEVDRAVQTISLSGEEAKRLYGESIPFDAAPSWTGQMASLCASPAASWLQSAPSTSR